MKQLFTLASIIFFFGCSKSDNDTANPSAPTKTALLTSKDWVMTSKQIKKVTDASWTDDFSGKSPCEKDDRIVFTTTGTYEFNEGASKCSPSDPFIIETGTWKFAQNETLIVITKTGSTTMMDATIETLNSTTLLLSYVERFLGVEYNIKQGYGH